MWLVVLLVLQLVRQAIAEPLSTFEAFQEAMAKGNTHVASHKEGPNQRMNPNKLEPLAKGEGQIGKIPFPGPMVAELGKSGISSPTLEAVRMSAHNEGNVCFFGHEDMLNVALWMEMPVQCNVFTTSAIYGGYTKENNYAMSRGAFVAENFVTGEVLIIKSRFDKKISGEDSLRFTISHTDGNRRHIRQSANQILLKANAARKGTPELGHFTPRFFFEGSQMGDSGVGSLYCGRDKTFILRCYVKVLDAAVSRDADRRVPSSNKECTLWPKKLKDQHDVSVDCERNPEDLLCDAFNVDKDLSTFPMFKSAMESNDKNTLVEDIRGNWAAYDSGTRTAWRALKGWNNQIMEFSPPDRLGAQLRGEEINLKSRIDGTPSSLPVMLYYPRPAWPYADAPSPGGNVCFLPWRSDKVTFQEMSTEQCTIFTTSGLTGCFVYVAEKDGKVLFIHTNVNLAPLQQNTANNQMRKEVSKLRAKVKSGDQSNHNALLKATKLVIANSKEKSLKHKRAVTAEDLVILKSYTRRYKIEPKHIMDGDYDHHDKNFIQASIWCGMEKSQLKCYCQQVTWPGTGPGSVVECRHWS